MRMFKHLSGIAIISAMALSLLIVGCAKEETRPEVSLKSNPDVTQIDPNGAYYLDVEGNVTQIDMESIDQENVGKLEARNGNAHLNAHYSHQPERFYLSQTLQLNATENKNGVSGVGHWDRTWGENGEFNYHVTMDADCMESNGVDAIFVGLVTSVEGDLPNIYPGVGARVWIRVKDNGEGPNAPLDQYKGSIINPSGTAPCGIFGLNSFFWRCCSGPYRDVANPSDNIQVR